MDFAERGEAQHTPLLQGLVGQGVDGKAILRHLTSLHIGVGIDIAQQRVRRMEIHVDAEVGPQEPGRRAALAPEGEKDLRDLA